jgi:DNA-binding MarR family transcriptional regulator
MANRVLAPRDFERLAAFRYALRKFLRFSEDAARRARTFPAQYLLLLFVRGFGARRPTIADLAERLQVSHQSAVELIDRSERAGLVRRQRDRVDARRVRIRLTPKGSRLLIRLVREHYAGLAELRRTVPEPIFFNIPRR